MSNPYDPNAVPTFAPGSFLPPPDYGKSGSQLLHEQMLREADRADMWDGLRVGAMLAAGFLPLIALGVSAATETACAATDKVPAVVCETNQHIRDTVTEAVVRILIPEQPFPQFPGID